jgi:xylose dehydrogenase (NAD/NADP)
MVDACDAARVTLMVGYMSLFNPLIEKLETAIASGKLGRIQYVHGQFSYPLPPAPGVWRMDAVQGKGPLFDVGIYPIFLTRHLTRQPWHQVTAIGAHRWWKDSPVRDTVVAIGELADGTLVSVETAFTHGGSYLRLEGEKGTLTIEDFFYRSCTGRVFGNMDGTEVDWTVDRAQVFRDQNYQREFEHFADCIREAKDPICSGRIALHDCATLEAMVESMDTGKRVSVAR